MKTCLMNGSNALTHRHSWPILEDIISLYPGEEVVCLICCNHPFFEMKQIVSKLKKNLENNPIKPVIINKKLCFAFRLQIQSNPTGDEIISGMKIKEEVIKCVTDKVYGAGVNAQLEFTGSHLFKYQSFFDHQFWSDGAANCLPQFKDVLRNVSAFHMISKSTIQLLQELEGDKVAYLQVLTFHDALICQCESNEMIKVLKEKQLSTHRMHTIFELDINMEEFKTFHYKIDNTCRAAIEECYGNLLDCLIQSFLRCVSTIHNTVKEKRLSKYSICCKGQRVKEG